MEIPLDREGATPLYQQIQAHIARLIREGALPAHARLPATRRLAGDLGVNRITVGNAYAELEAAGLVYAQTGRGTFVAPETPHSAASEATPQAWPLWQQALAARPAGRRSPAAERWRGLLARAHEPGVISFAGGVPDLETFPVDDFRKAMRAVFRRDGAAAMDYGAAQGYAPLREAIARFLGEQGIAASAEEVFIASGSQQALSLVAMALLRPGDTVVVESPTYANAIQLFNWLDARLVGVPTDEEGLRVELLEHLLKHHPPRLIYVMPTFHNPTGVTLSGARRRALLALAERYGLPVVEDDYVGDLRYDGPRAPSLRALDRAGNVVHVSTFSKSLMPGPRVGFVLTRGPLLERLIALKRRTDLGTSGLIQRALQVYMGEGRWRAHTRRVSRVYRRRRDAMVAAMERYFPSQAHWSTPQGGFFVWVRLPLGVSIHDLYLAAIERGVAFAPGPLFFPGEPPYPALRLSFSQEPPERILQGIERLGRALREVLSREPPVETTDTPQVEVSV
ncbi:MAG: PLP-dependent aminotransferase family protein [Anaerolineae bacterium]|jgi:GntR family transcriptional regulator/MocR family aminotransferase